MSIDFRKWTNDDEDHIHFTHSDGNINTIIEKFNPYIRLDKP
jgi:hypothetical protein